MKVTVNMPLSLRYELVKSLPPTGPYGCAALEMLHLHACEDSIHVPLIRLMLQWADVS